MELSPAQLWRGHGTRDGSTRQFLTTMLQLIVRSAGRSIRPVQTASLHTTAFLNTDTVFQTKKLERTYHPGGYENSVGYRRARKPYLIRNTIAFFLLSSFIGGVYAYSIMMVCTWLNPDSTTGGTG